MAADYWAHFYHDHPKATIEDEDDDFDQDAIMKAMEDHPEDWETIISNGATDGTT